MSRSWVLSLGQPDKPVQEIAERLRGSWNPYPTLCPFWLFPSIACAGEMVSTTAEYSLTSAGKLIIVSIASSPREIKSARDLCAQELHGNHPPTRPPLYAIARREGQIAAALPLYQPCPLDQGGVRLGEVRAQDFCIPRLSLVCFAQAAASRMGYNRCQVTVNLPLISLYEAIGYRTVEKPCMANDRIYRTMEAYFPQ